MRVSSTFHGRFLAAFACLGLVSCGGGGGGDEGGDTTPTLASINVAAGPAAGGQAVTLTGTGFAEPATVSFGGTDATAVSVDSDTAISCQTPAGPAGATVDVVVTTPTGSATLAGAFTYVAAPTVTGVNPGNGPPAGSTAITVTGTGFSAGVSRVRVGTANATNISVQDDTMLTCDTPAGNGTVNVAVTTPGGTGTGVSLFAYDTTVTLTAVTPDTGFTAGGTCLTLTGSGFTNGAAGTNTVTVGGASATNVVAVDDTTLTCQAPTGATGALRDVQVSNGNGTASLTGVFEYFGFGPNLTTPNKRVDFATATPVRSESAKIYCEGTNVYALWEEGPTGGRDVTFSRSTDSGATWSTPVKLNTNTAGASDSIAASMCVDGSTLNVIWRDDRNNQGGLNPNFDTYTIRSTNGGVSWTGEQRLNTIATAGTQDTRYQVICCSGQYVYAAWSDERASNNSQHDDIRFNRSTDGGATWLSSDVNVRNASLGSSPSTIEIACCGTNVYLVWRDTRNSNTNFDIYFNRSTDYGATWPTTDLRLNTDTAGTNRAQLPKICCEGSDVHVCWPDDRNGSNDVYYNRSTNNGASFQASDTRINSNTAGASFSNNPEICCEKGNVYIAWVDDRNNFTSGKDVYFARSTNAGASFATDMKISRDSVASSDTRWPHLCCSGGHVYVLWIDGRNANRGDTYYSCSIDQGASFLATDVQLNDDTGDNFQDQPALCCDGARAYFLWKDNRAHLTNSDLYMVATTP